MFQVIHKALEANNNQDAEPRAPQSFAMQNPSPNEGRFELKSSHEPGSQFPPSSTFVKSLWMPPASCTHTSASLHSNFPSLQKPVPTSTTALPAPPARQWHRCPSVPKHRVPCGAAAVSSLPAITHRRQFLPHQ